ncbi:MAG: polysaccharide deacetylase family protein [Deinococcales bacterium]|nr:polysaccharide deacetylase family protein [Chitinophagaceae bacterium]
MFTKKLSIIYFGLFFTGWLIGCHNTSFSAVATNDTLVKNAPAKNIFKLQSYTYDSTKNYIYLTFDDGPQNGTVSCFNVCKALGVKASFFMVGVHANSKRTKEIVTDIRNAYPDVLLCNHSSTHAFRGKYQYFYHHPDLAIKDFYKAQKSLQVPLKIIRLPGNSAWVRTNDVKASHIVKPICLKLDSAGYNVIGWDVEWNFSHKTETPIQSTQKMLNIVDSAMAKNRLHTKNHLVILTHDRMFKDQNYTDSLTKFIAKLKIDKRNVFETIDHYPGVK